MDIQVIKKNGNRENFNPDKIIKAIESSALRAMVDLTDSQKERVVSLVKDEIETRAMTTVSVEKLHAMVEGALETVSPETARSYKEYRNFKMEFGHIMSDIYNDVERINYRGDKENSNKDSSLVSTKKSLSSSALYKEIYKNTFLTDEERRLAKEGDIYIHDMSDRLLSMNCCLFNIGNVLKGGFEMANIWYNEPKSLDVAFDVISDVVLSAASQQYGGFTLPQIDKVLSYYAEKSYKAYYEKELDSITSILAKHGLTPTEEDLAECDRIAMEQVAYDYKQGFQGWEMKFNTVASSRGDYPFITVTSGLATDKFSVMGNQIMYKVHMNGQGKDGNKKPVLFPKYVFLYDKELHSEGKPLYDVYKAGLECSQKTMYPDWLSLTGEGYVPSMYKEYKQVVSPMGCIIGTSLIKVIINDEKKNISIADLYSFINELPSAQRTIKSNKIGNEIWLKDKNIILIWDTKLQNYTPVYRIIRRNPDQNQWMHIVIDCHHLDVTTDHPFETENRGMVLAKDLLIGDIILCDNNNSVKKCQVSDILINNNLTDYSYDVTTDSEHFEFNGVYSHNCRAFLSPWYKVGLLKEDGTRDHFEKATDIEDEPVFEGRFNSGAISLNLPLILLRSRVENRSFYDVLDERLETIRSIHKRTRTYLGNLSASTNPLAFTQGGFIGGHLDYTNKVRDSFELMDSTTYSFGITALDELQKAYNGKSIAEDGTFSLSVLQYINEKAQEFKKEDHMLYAIYGTPAENLCLSGDTLVQTYEGYKQIKDLTTKDLVYSFNEKLKKIELKKVAFAGKTGTNRKVIKVTFDNGQEIVCTPNHKFAVRKLRRNTLGQIIEEYIEYVEAKDLTKGIRIKSNYIYENSHGRYECSNYYNGRHQLIQDINAEFAYGIKPQDCVTHHKNEDKLDNSFSNLEYMPDKDHRIHHLPITIQDYQFTSDSVKGDKNPFYGKHHTDKAKMLNRLAHIGKSILHFTLDGILIEEFECANDAAKAGFTRHLLINACKGLNKNTHQYKNSLWYYKDNCPIFADANHKVESIEYLENTIDVYDINVEDNHNFFVGGEKGILVHNCGLQIKQLRTYVEQNADVLKEFYKIEEKNGQYVIPEVCDHEYVSNSFHCNVREDLSPIAKQDLENRFWNYSNGGKIQYVRYPLGYNKNAMDTLIKRAMGMGFYEGCNMALSYCDDCGYEQLEMQECPRCGSKNLTKIDRMNGYLSYSRVKGESRLNDAKMAEIEERRSM